MKLLDHDLSNLCFDDYKVESMTVDHNKKIIRLQTDGGCLIIDQKITELKCVTLIISEWQEISILMYIANEKKFIDLNNHDYDILREINEIKYNGTLELSGFGKKTGEWITYKIKSPKIDIITSNVEVQAQDKR